MHVSQRKVKSVKTNELSCHRERKVISIGAYTLYNIAAIISNPKVTSRFSYSKVARIKTEIISALSSALPRKLKPFLKSSTQRINGIVAV